MNSLHRPRSMGCGKDIAFCLHPNTLELGMEYNNLHKGRQDIDSLSRSKLF